MRFTDDGINNLKEELEKKNLPGATYIFDVQSLIALLARLEAAEEVIEYAMGSIMFLDDADYEIKKWREAAGK